MSRKKPKTLYRYDCVEHKLEKHHITAECMPERIITDNCAPGSDSDDLWRCRNDDHDIYGWDTQKASKMEDIQNIKSEICRLQALLKEKTKEEPAKKEEADVVHN